MIVLGLTGSIGMGKTTIAEMFHRCGVPTHNADTAVHALLQPDGKAFDAVAYTFPDAIEYGQVNRQILGRIVFNDPRKKAALEGIMHPLVRNVTHEFVRQNRFLGRKMVLLDIPLLFETGADKRVHYTICATAPHFVQKRRVLQRPGMTEEKFQNILRAQLPDAFKRCCSDFVINTARSKAQCLRDVKRIMARVYKK